MKAEHVGAAAQLVSEAKRLEVAANALLHREDDEVVTVRVQVSGMVREITSADLPATYVAKMLKDYREAVVMQAESMGVSF